MLEIRARDSITREADWSDAWRQLAAASPVLPRVAFVSDAGPAIDQRWYWSADWQAGEAQASEDIAARRTTRFADPDDFLRTLR